MIRLSPASRLAALLLALTFFALPARAAAEDGSAVRPLSEGADLRVMSYNILHPDWSRVPVNGRDGIVAAILLRYMPDVAAIQEAGAKWHKALRPLLTDPGFYAPACRQSNAEGFIYCTTTFLYNPKTVALVEETVLDLDFKDAARVFSVAVFERLSDGRRFVIANTHPAPRDEYEKYLRNMADVTALAAALKEKYPGLPVIVAGDFNTPEDSDPYHLFMEQADLRDAKYEADEMRLGCSTYFGYPSVPDTESTDLCVDHIFVGGGIEVKLFSAVADPGVEDASDHLPIYADLALK